MAGATPFLSWQVPEVPVDGFLTYPRVNQQLRFRGNLQHGVQGNLAVAVPPPAEGEQDGGQAAAATQPAARCTLLVNFWRERPLPPNCVEFPAGRWQQLGQQRDESSLRALLDPHDASLASPPPPARPGAFEPMPLAEGSTATYSFEVAPTNMHFFAVRHPPSRGNWRIDWRDAGWGMTSFGPIARLDLEHRSCVSSLFSSSLPKLFLVLHAGGQRHWEGHRPKWLPKLLGEFGADFKVVLADPSATADFLRAFSLSASDAPTVVIHDTAAGASNPEAKHRLPGGTATKLTKQRVWAFVDEFLVESGRRSGRRSGPRQPPERPPSRKEEL